MDALLDGVRSAGLPVELAVDGVPPRAPGGRRSRGLSRYSGGVDERTQVRRAAHAWVGVRWRDEELELEIANDGSGDGDGTGGGHGLAGMRERVSLYGGEIKSAVHVDGGGYVVRAAAADRGELA